MGKKCSQLHGFKGKHSVGCSRMVMFANFSVLEIGETAWIAGSAFGFLITIITDKDMHHIHSQVAYIWAYGSLCSILGNYMVTLLRPSRDGSLLCYLQLPIGNLQIPLQMSNIIIDREAGEIICLVASVCLFCLWICVSELYLLNPLKKIIGHYHSKIFVCVRDLLLFRPAAR